MDMSESIAELAGALCKFQGEMKAVAFDATNPFFKSKYATLSALVDGASKLLAKHGLAISQLCTDDGAVMTILMHESGQYISSTMKLTPTKNDPQGVGSSITYNRRYSYASILGLVSEADDDGNSASVPVAKVAIPEPAKPYVKPTQDAPKTAPVAPQSTNLDKTLSGILMGVNVKKGTSKAGKPYIVTEYTIKDGIADYVVSCFGDKAEIPDWTEVICSGITEQEFKGKKQYKCDKIEPLAPIEKSKDKVVNPEDIAWEE